MYGAGSQPGDVARKIDSGCGTGQLRKQQQARRDLASRDELERFGPHAVVPNSHASAVRYQVGAVRREGLDRDGRQVTAEPGGKGPPAIRVLLVEDQQIVAESLRLLLGSVYDIEVVGVAGTVAAGTAETARLHPDVVLMDYRLPDGDGITAARKIVADLKAAVVILTASGDDDELVLRALEAGCAGFVAKSEAVSTLVSAVRAASAGELLIGPSVLARLLPRISRHEKPISAALSSRELEVLGLMTLGCADREIARRLFISVNTARKHVQNVVRKLGAHSKLEAVMIAVRGHIVHP
jgi:DNA-binding NarL/FixJ family response regulator